MQGSLLALGVLLVLVSGCGTCSTRGQLPIEYHGGEPNLETMTYQTSEVFGEYLHFPAGRRFDLMHGLGVPPQAPVSWVSFQREPASRDDSGENTGNIAESAGNQVVVECLDDERVRVRNDTCAEFFLRVELRADSELSQVVMECD
jgi:hypothetical protein